MYKILCLFLFGFALAAQETEEKASGPQGSSLTGKIIFVNSQSKSIFIESQKYSVEFVTNFATKYTSGKNPIGYRDLKTNQKVQFTFAQTGDIYELLSIDVTDPQLPADKDLPKPKIFHFSGKIQSVQPFNRYVTISSGGTVRTLIVSKACKFTQGKKGGDFSDLRVGQAVTVEAIKTQGNRYDPMSVTIH